MGGDKERVSKQKMLYSGANFSDIAEFWKSSVVQIVNNQNRMNLKCTKETFSL